MRNFVPEGPDGGLTCTEVPGDVDVVNTAGEVVDVLVPNDLDVLVLVGSVVAAGAADVVEAGTDVVVSSAIVVVRAEVAAGPLVVGRAVAPVGSGGEAWVVVAGPLFPPHAANRSSAPIISGKSRSRSVRCSMVRALLLQNVRDPASHCRASRAR